MEASYSKVRVTADTNVFYYLGDGSLRKSDIIGPNEELWATPIDIMEILDYHTDDWSQRQSAAKAIIEHAGRLSLDPTQHIVAIIERLSLTCDITGKPNEWWTIAKLFADATNEEDFRRKASPQYISEYKAAHYATFFNRLVHECENEVPGYQTAIIEKSQTPIVEKHQRQETREKIGSMEYLIDTFRAVVEGRYLGLPGKSIDTVKGGFQELAPYCAIYGAYCKQLLTERRKPCENDWGDLELFLFLQPGTFVATAEKKWWTVAESAGLASRIRQVVPTEHRHNS